MSDLLASDRNNIWHPFTPLVTDDPPLLIESAQGVYLNTADGRKIIDGISSWWVNLHGHANPHIANAIASQASKLEHVIFAGFTHEPAITLSENLLGILPENQRRVFFSDDGSTAVEVALKMSLQFWYNQGIERKKIVAIKGAYHGDTFGSMSVGERSLFTHAFASHMFPVEFVEFPRQDNETEVLDQFRRLIAAKDIATFIYEPLLQGAAGMRIYSAAVLDKMIEHAKANEVLCVADEVLTGFGRTGKLFASDHLTNKPDIIALSKGLTGGTMPMGVTSCSEKIVSAFESADLNKTFFHGHSFTANPLSCAAANASFELLLRPSCLENIARISSQHQSFAAYIGKNPGVQEVRTLGTMVALELKTSEKTSYTNPLRKKAYSFFLDRDVLLRPLGNVVYILPPYVINDMELQTIYEAIEEFLHGHT
jgi:adenosylmethionine---8-amino-7-oxononanoate aminotransferase